MSKKFFLIYLLLSTGDVHAQSSWGWLIQQGVETYAWLIALFPLVFKKVRDTLLKKILDLPEQGLNLLSQWIVGLSHAFFFQRRYDQHVIYEHRIFNVRGLRTIGTLTLKLEQVFVEPFISSSRNPQKANINPVLAKELEGGHSLCDFLRPRKHNEFWVLAIIGAPGCGKTTLLQHLALVFANKQHRRYGLSAYVPVLLFLRQHVEKIVQENLPLAELAQSHFSDTKKYPHLKPPLGWFERYLTQGQCIVLLDGLDEVAGLEHRQKISTWLDKQIINYPRCYFIITARPQGYLSAPVQHAHVLEVQPFTYEQVQQFVHIWYLENEVTSMGGQNDEGVKHKAKREAEDLLQRLREYPALNNLTVNPLLLTMIAMVHRYRGQLPGRRVELYAEICDVLLGHWRKAKGIQDTLTAAQKRVVLQPLAARMMHRKIRDISTEEAMQIIHPPLRRVGLRGEEAKNFLKDVEASSGLLLEKEVGIWSFAHLTFQEYLAAAHFIEQKIKLAWGEMVNESWWHESLRLYAAQGDATTLVQACLTNNSILALTLAVDCLEEARELDIVVRTQVEELLNKALESDDPERRKLAAEVRLKRRIKS